VNALLFTVPTALVTGFNNDAWDKFKNGLCACNSSTPIYTEYYLTLKPPFNNCNDVYQLERGVYLSTFGNTTVFSSVALILCIIYFVFKENLSDEEKKKRSLSKFQRIKQRILVLAIVACTCGAIGNLNNMLNTYFLLFSRSYGNFCGVKDFTTFDRGKNGFNGKFGFDSITFFWVSAFLGVVMMW
jgi:hypothetical protein